MMTIKRITATVKNKGRDTYTNDDSSRIEHINNNYKNGDYGVGDSNYDDD